MRRYGIIAGAGLYRVIILAAAYLFILTGPLCGSASAAGNIAARPDYPFDFSSVVDAAMPILVKIENESMAPAPKSAVALGKDAKTVSVKKGTGFFIDKQGYILTNYHVVTGAERLHVIDYKRRGFDAELVGADPLTDLAVIKIDPDYDISPAIAGDSDQLKVGQPVLALGNPLGLEFLATAGIVSGFGPPGADDPGCFDFIQLDVNIQPGNSGGPLLNAKGEVVGVNSLNLGKSSGIGFAIPFNRAKEVAELIKKNGSVSRGYLGVESQPMTVIYAQRLGLDYVRGAIISTVVENGPASYEDIRQGDAILEFNGVKVKDGRDLDRLVYLCPADTKVKLLVARGPGIIPVTVTLGELESNVVDKEAFSDKCTLTLKELTDDMAEGMGLTESGGLVVVEVSPSCPAYTDGLRFADIIKKVDDDDVDRPSDFYKAYSRLAPGGSMVLTVIRGGKQTLLTLKQSDKH